MAIYGKWWYQLTTNIMKKCADTPMNYTANFSKVKQIKTLAKFRRTWPELGAG